MSWTYECRKVQSGCSYTVSVSSRDEAKKLGLMHLKDAHRLNPDSNWQRVVESAIR